MMRNRWTAIVLMLSTAISVSAQLAEKPVEPPPSTVKPDLPSADSVLQHFVVVTGGSKNYQAVKTEIAAGTFAMKAAGVNGSIKIYSAVPAKQYSIIEIPGVGKMEEGTDGKMAWENSAVQGPRILTGSEAAAAIRKGALDIFTEWKKYYKSAEITGTESIDGKTCYKVVMTPLVGEPETDYYDKDSGLLVKQASIAETPMGKVPNEIMLTDYTKEGELLMPHRINLHMAGQEFEIKVDKFELNADIPDSRFDIPAEIKALQK